MEPTTREQVLRFDDDHEEFFDPKEYLRRYASLESSIAQRWILHTFMQHHHKFWTTMQSRNLIMLEFGGGPCIYSLISACPHVREIVFAEFTEPNRNEVNAWLRKDKSAFDWSLHFKHVVQTLEGKAQQDSFDREEELRRKITQVIPCDIRQEQPLMVKNAQQLKFDVVASNSCLEVPVESDDMFCEAVAKLVKLVKQGGHLILTGFLNCTNYYVGKEKFSNFPVSESLVRRALNECEMEILHFEVVDRRPDLEEMGNDEVFDGLFSTLSVLKNVK